MIGIISERLGTYIAGAPLRKIVDIDRPCLVGFTFSPLRRGRRNGSFFFFFVLLPSRTVKSMKNVASRCGRGETRVHIFASPLDSFEFSCLLTTRFILQHYQEGGNWKRGGGRKGKHCYTL